ncbi:hypothetical protein SDC9_62091 [bioreactor metagenome]|uniref:Type I restriction modification DNA specificity domain-containing protein n=1 Tax=bioreactor metagenome TaxID=1076179 RepID=A0A644XI14_9ZZZZ
MGSEWKSLQLGDICELRAGSVFPPALQGKLTGTYPFVKVSDMNLPANALYIQVANNWINDTEMVKLKAKPFPVGTTIFAKIGEALKANRLRFLIQPTILDNNMMGAIPTENEVDPRFFFYSLSQFDFGEIADGTALPYLTVNGLSKLPVMLPPLSDQHSIAHILGTLDEKIELNRRMNETLEAMARALFKSWFVDFDPVRAKVEGRDTGLPPEISDLFPDEFVDSELGEIPKGWRVDAIYEVADVVYGAPFSSKLFNSNKDGKPLIRIRDLINENPGIWTAEIHPKGYLVNPGEIVVGMDGEFRAYLWGGEKAWLNQRLCVFRPKDSVPSFFLFNTILAPLAEVEATEIATTVIHLGKNDIDRFKSIISPINVLNAFGKITQPLFHKIIIGKQQSRTLSSLRDTLLPKLISGEIRVGEAEKYLEVVET